VVLRQSNLSFLLGFGGPAEIHSEDVTYFASASLTKKFSRGRVWADYVRTEDASSGYGRSAIFDSVALNGWWNVDQRWRWRGVAGWRNRQFEVEVVGPGGLSGVSKSEISDIWLETSLVRTINDRISLQFRFRYDRQLEGRADQTITTGWDNFTGAVTLRYEFKPFRF
jgi:hypothetical protein